MTQRLRSLIPGLLFLLLASPASLPARDLPKVRVENVRRAYHNGEHNAFTDLVKWQGRLWLTFRSCPEGHMVYPSSTVRILSSEDGREWREEHRFSVPRRDVRDPHFLVFRDRLFVYTGTWYSGEGELPRDQYDLNKHLGYGVSTADGKEWEGPRPLEGTYGHYIWRAAARGGVAYLCARRKSGHAEASSGTTRDGEAGVESALLESEDGWNWRFRSLVQESMGNETAYLFEEDASLLALSRESRDGARLSRARPPYEQWERFELDRFIGGPLLARWQGRLLVGGRQKTEAGPRTTLYWLEQNQLHPFAELPSDGDNSYPGFVEMGKGRGLVSWYSSHEKGDDGKPITAIYLADLVLDEP